MKAYFLKVLLIMTFLISTSASAFAGPMDDLLIKSIANENMQMIRTAIANGADVNYRPNEYSITPLVMAINKNNSAVIQFLINNGADVNLQSINGNLTHTPLTAAILNDNSKIVRQLINAGSDVNAGGKNTYCPLTFALNNYCNYEIVSLLIAKNANVNIEENGYTPLMAAASYRNGWGGDTYKTKKMMAAKLLLKAGADSSTINYRNNKTALQYAIDTGFMEMVNLLLPISPKN